MQLPDAGYRDWGRVSRFYAGLGDALRRHSDIVAVSMSDRLPFDPAWRIPYGAPGMSGAAPSDLPEAQIESVDDGCFAALRVPVVPGRADAAPLRQAISDEIRQLDPGLPIPEVKPLQRVLQTSVDPSRFVMLLMSVFAMLALAIAAVGIYGILSYGVSRRRREIGIRLALGAEPSTIRRMVIREGLAMAAIGSVVGIVGAQLSGKLLTRFMYDTRPSDPSTLALMVGAVLGVALIACAVPAWRASAEDPTTAPRAE